MRARLLGALAAVAFATACGIDPQAAPEDLDVSPLAPATSEAPSSTAGQQLVLWFLRDDVLAPVERSAGVADPATALDLLAEGPTAEEAADGLATAISRQDLAVAEEDPAADDAAGDEDVLTVEVTDAFTSVAGEDQLRSFAQVVWTATEFDGVEGVRFTADGGPLEVPTDAGLTDEPVDRGDFASLAPDGSAAAN